MTAKQRKRNSVVMKGVTKSRNRLRRPGDSVNSSKLNSSGGVKNDCQAAACLDVVADKYELLEVLGNGSSGEVWRAQDIRSPGYYVALKIMTKHGHSVKARQAWEISEYMAASKSVRIGFFILATERIKFNGRQCLIFELAGMSLRSLLRRSDLCPLPLRHIRSISWQLSVAIDYLHSINIVHGDLKPENIVLVDDTLVQIWDLTSVRVFKDKYILRSPEIKIIDLEDSQIANRRLTHVSGTIGYRSPEVWLGLPWSFPVDVYSVGCIFFELWTLVGVHPITTSLHNTLAFMEKAVGPFREKFVLLMQEDYKLMFFSGSPPHVKPSHDAGDREFLNLSIGKVKPVRLQVLRPDFCSLIGACLQLDPADRMSMRDVLSHRFFGYLSYVNGVDEL